MVVQVRRSTVAGAAGVAVAGATAAMTVAQGANRGGGAELWWGGRKEMK